jgi:protein gp37
MAEQTGIAWAHHTFNPWVGCTKIGPGCLNCYAERDMDRRRQFVKWGVGMPRRRTVHTNWGNIVRWDRKARAAGERRRLFCASLADVFDNEVDPQWRLDLWTLIESTPGLDWLLLTKRIGNVPGMLPKSIARLPYVWLGATVVNQEEVERDVPKLAAIRTGGPKWLSMEPLLEAVTFGGREGTLLDGIGWVVVGGESGPHARPFDAEWAIELAGQCDYHGVPMFFKQGSENNWPNFKDFASFPPSLQIREFPR